MGVKGKHVVGALAAALLLQGCSGGAPEPEPTPEPTLEVADSFEDASWNVQADELSDERPPVIAGTTLVYYSDAALHGVNATGDEAWTKELDDFAPDARKNAPEVRYLSNESVVVYDFGKTSGEGLEEEKESLVVQAISTRDGSVLGKKEFDGDARVSAQGNAVGSDGKPATMVTETGKFEQIPGSQKRQKYSENKLDLFGVIAGEPFWGDGDQVTFNKWSSTKITGKIEGGRLDAGAEAPTQATPAGRAPVAEITWSPRTGDPGRAFVSPKDGKEVFKDESCLGDIRDSSPNGRYLVGSTTTDGSTDSESGIVDLETGEIECLGGDGQKPVDLRRVTNDGRAFGTVNDGGEDQFIDATSADESAISAAPAEGVELLGFLDDLAIHWNADEGLITANQIKTFTEAK